MKITRIPKEKSLSKLRVAAYARVSTTLMEQEDSYETQKAFYEKRIRANPEWEFAGVYADQKSGTEEGKPHGL